MAAGIGGKIAFHNPVAVIAHRGYTECHCRLAAVEAAADTQADRSRAGDLRDGTLCNRTGDTGIGFFAYLVDTVV